MQPKGISRQVWEAYADALAGTGQVYRLNTKFVQDSTQKRFVMWDPVSERHSGHDAYVAIWLLLNRKVSDLGEAFDYAHRLSFENRREAEEALQAVESFAQAWDSIQPRLAEFAKVVGQVFSDIAENFERAFGELGEVSQRDFEVTA